MVKRVFIVHRWSGKPETDWYPWLKQGLENKGYGVFVPEMSDSDEPEIDKWVAHLAAIVAEVDEETHFVAHSIGCQATMRYLARQDKKAGKLFMITPWFHLVGLEDQKIETIAKPWLEIPIDLDKVKENTASITAIFSDNDPYVPLSDEELFKEKLGAETFMEKEKGHFTKDDGITEIPLILKYF